MDFYFRCQPVTSSVRGGMQSTEYLQQVEQLLGRQCQLANQRRCLSAGSLNQ